MEHSFPPPLEYLLSHTLTRWKISFATQKSNKLKNCLLSLFLVHTHRMGPNSVSHQKWVRQRQLVKWVSFGEECSIHTFPSWTLCVSHLAPVPQLKSYLWWSCPSGTHQCQSGIPPLTFTLFYPSFHEWRNQLLWKVTLLLTNQREESVTGFSVFKKGIRQKKWQRSFIAAPKYMGTG